MMIKKIGLIVLILTLLITPVQANSAQTWFEGRDSSGIVVLKDSSPLVVRHEKLTFNISDFPQYLSSLENFKSYNSHVIAQYQIYNPSSLTIKSRLLFPFGINPSYMNQYNQQENKNEDIDQYLVSVDDKEINKTLRHTYKHSNEDFSLEEDLSKIVDHYKQDSFYTRKLPVTKITYQIQGVDTHQYTNAYACMSLKNNPQNTRVYMKQLNGYKTNEDNVQMGLFVGDTKNIEVYFIGQPIQDVKWSVYKDSTSDKIINGKANIVSKEELTFEDLAMSKYNEDSQILAMDWYNAIVDMIHDEESMIIDIENDLDISHELMRWYDYTIEVKPNTSIINKVIAPIYPAIDSNYNPPIYEYTYLLSPASRWKEFENLEIEIHTNYFLVKDNFNSFLKTDDGYSMTLKKLPSTELQFTLCSQKKATNHQDHFIPCLSIITIINIIIIYIIIRRKKS